MTLQAKIIERSVGEKTCPRLLAQIIKDGVAIGTVEVDDRSDVLALRSDLRAEAVRIVTFPVGTVIDL